MDSRDQNEFVEEFKKIFWEQYPIDQFVRIDGNLIVEVLKEIDGLEDKCRNEGMYPYA